MAATDRDVGQREVAVLVSADGQLVLTEGPSGAEIGAGDHDESTSLGWALFGGLDVRASVGRTVYEIREFAEELPLVEKRRLLMKSIQLGVDTSFAETVVRLGGRGATPLVVGAAHGPQYATGERVGDLRPSMA